MFSALFFSRVINYLKSTSHLDQMEQDANTITAGDFTVEMDISHAMWDKFKDEIYPKVENMALLNGVEVEDARLSSYWSRMDKSSFQPIR